MESILLGVSNILEPTILLFLLLGVLVGSFFAAVPGLGGMVPISILLPWAITMGPYPLIAMLFGIAGVANTANSFPSILIAVPGSVGSQATILDGYPMARKGEAARAFGAAFTASAVGCVIGAAALLLAVPIMRPLVLALGSPELFMLIVVALSTVGVLSTGAYAKGLVGALLGVIIATIGIDTKSGVARFTFDTLYFWDGIDLALIGLGVFAIPEILSLGMKQSSIAERQPIGHGLIKGIVDTWRHWYLTLRSSVIGVAVGFLPGIGGSVVDWIAYAHAVQSEKKNPNFGHGDVRGVIAAEAANSAKEGGALIPTLGFGIPGSPGNALILVGMIAVGFAPGPRMLSSQVDVIFSIATVLLIAGLAASVLSLALSNQVAKIATLPYYALVPLILGAAVVAAYSSNFSVYDLLVLIIASIVGFYMKRYGWPRPPLMLGAVLGSQAESYLWLSVQRYDLNWVTRPVVSALIIILLLILASPLIKKWNEKRKATGAFATPDQASSSSPSVETTRILRITPQALFALATFAVLVAMTVVSTGYPIRASIMILVAGTIGAVLCLKVLFDECFAVEADPTVQPIDGISAPRIFDIGDGMASGAWMVWGWFTFLFVLIWLVGFEIGVPAFVAIYARANGASWRVTALITAIQALVIVSVFGWLMGVPWPSSVIGSLF